MANTKAKYAHLTGGLSKTNLILEKPIESRSNLRFQVIQERTVKTLFAGPPFSSWVEPVARRERNAPSYYRR